MSEVNSGTTIFCEGNQHEHVFWLLQNLGCIGSSLIEKQRHVLERLDVYWDNRSFNCKSRLILTYFEQIVFIQSIPSLLATPWAWIEPFLTFAKFKVDRLCRSRTGARQVFTIQKPFPSEIPLTMETNIKFSLKPVF